MRRPRRVAFRSVNTIQELVVDRAATLDWTQCPAVESVPGKLGGAYWIPNGNGTDWIKNLRNDLATSYVDKVLSLIQ